MRTDLKPSPIAKLRPKTERDSLRKYHPNGCLQHICNYYARISDPVMWCDVPFANYKQAAQALDHNANNIARHWERHGTLDHIPPRKNSPYYSKYLQDDKYHFIPRVISQYGLKAVARAYRVDPNNVRKKRRIGTLWTYAWWPRINRQANHPKLTTEQDLVARILKPPRRPYVYLVCWKNPLKRYIGSRTADYCSPDDLMKSYFSSSPQVMEWIYNHGLPTTHYIYECEDVISTLTTESLLLRFVGMSSARIRKRYLNKMYSFRNIPYTAPYIASNADRHKTRQRKGLIDD